MSSAGTRILENDLKNPVHDENVLSFGYNFRNLTITKNVILNSYSSMKRKSEKLG